MKLVKSMPSLMEGRIMPSLQKWLACAKLTALSGGVGAIDALRAGIRLDEDFLCEILGEKAFESLKYSLSLKQTVHVPVEQDEVDFLKRLADSQTEVPAVFLIHDIYFCPRFSNAKQLLLEAGVSRDALHETITRALTAHRHGAEKVAYSASDCSRRCDSTA